MTREGSREFEKPVPKYKSAAGGGGSLGDAVAPMPGVIEKVAVEDGAVVGAGDPLVIMIAMKMEYVIKVGIYIFCKDFFNIYFCTRRQKRVQSRKLTQSWEILWKRAKCWSRSLKMNERDIFVKNLRDRMNVHF